MKKYDLHERFHSKFCYPVTENDQLILHIQNPYVLSQIVGYAKLLASERGKMVLLRGQSSLHNCKMLPSLYRTLKNDKKLNKRNEVIEHYCDKVYRQFLVESNMNLNKSYFEPILQHYGINTRWIDLVDNIWIALWFATHTLYFMDRIRDRKPIYAKWEPVDDDDCYRKLEFEERKVHYRYRRVYTGKTWSIFKSTSIKECHNNSIMNPVSRYAYILLLESGMKPTEFSGLYVDEELQSNVVDLRCVCPSVFLRPHNQHGLLIRKIAQAHDSLNNYDYFEQFVVGILRVEIKDALKWLGDGFLLKPEFLFPSPFSDFMYRYLLEMDPPDSLELGSIMRFWQ